MTKDKSKINAVTAFRTQQAAEVKVVCHHCLCIYMYLNVLQQCCFQEMCQNGDNEDNLLSLENKD